MASTNLNNAIERIETAVDSQAELLAQLGSILDGKAAGSGGGNVETCSVTIEATIGNIVRIAYTKCENDEICSYYECEHYEFTVTCENVVKNSILVICVVGYCYDGAEFPVTNAVHIGSCISNIDEAVTIFYQVN